MKTKTILCALVAILAAGVCLARPGGGIHHGPRPSFHHFSNPRYHRPPPPHHHHHHGGGGFVSGLVGGIVGGAIVSAIAEPAPVVVQETVVQQPVVVQQPAPVVVQQPAPVIVQQPVVQQVVQQPVTQVQNVWVEGQYVNQLQPDGSTVRVWNPGHYEQRSVVVQ